MNNNENDSGIVMDGSDEPDTEDSIQPEIEANGGLILPDQNLPDHLLLLPIFERPFFPAQVQPLVIDEDPWQETFAALSKMDSHLLGLCYAGDQEAAKANPDDFEKIGCVVKLHNVVASNGKIQFIAQGLQRFKLTHWISRDTPFAAEVIYPPEKAVRTPEIKAYAMALIQSIKELIPLNPLYNEELKNFLNHFNLNEPSPLADFAAAITTAPGSELQKILNTVPLQKRMQKVLRSEVEQKMTKHQREFFLREELKIIQRELGIAKDDRTSDIDQFKARMEKRNAPEHVQNRFDDEIKKMTVLETER